MNNASKSAFGGLISTIPMTIFMSSLFKKLPTHEQAPLPPRTIAMKLAEEANVKKDLSEKQKYIFTLFGHYSYGAFASSFFFPLMKRLSISNYVGGACYGLLVWAGSYLGWLPLTRLYKSATKMSYRRNALMIGAHIIWGLSLGMFYEFLERKKSPNFYSGGLH
jgi:uncharacterized membrane protein YagU involved in acid resistance